jgi:hypothetical protein
MQDDEIESRINGDSREGGTVSLMAFGLASIYPARLHLVKAVPVHSGK